MRHALATLLVLLPLGACATLPEDPVSLAGDDDGKADGVQGRKVRPIIDAVATTIPALRGDDPSYPQYVAQPLAHGTASVDPGDVLTIASTLHVLHHVGMAFNVQARPAGWSGAKNRFFLYRHTDSYSWLRDAGEPEPGAWAMVTCKNDKHAANFFSGVTVDRLVGTLTTAAGWRFSFAECGLGDRTQILGVLPFPAWDDEPLDGDYAYSIYGDCLTPGCWIP
jgi:hypothetical protein